MTDIIIPAISIPKAIIGNDFFILMSVRAAISAPVQPPVPGRGIATNKSRPQSRQRLDLFAVSHRTDFELFDDFREYRLVAQELEYLAYEKQDERYRQDVADIAYNKGTQKIDVQQLRRYHAAAQLENRQQRDEKNYKFIGNLVLKKVNEPFGKFFGHILSFPCGKRCRQLSVSKIPCLSIKRRALFKIALSFSNFSVSRALSKLSQI